MEQWEIDLNNELKNDKQIIIVKQNKKSSNGLLIFVIFILIVIFLGLFAYKKVEKFKYWIQNHFKVENISNIIDDKEKNKNFWDKIDLIEEQLKKNSRKLNLLGISHNENFSILENKNPDENFIILNHDWSLNRLPKNIEINPEDKKFIEENTKP